jgi:Zn-dependent protease with chaperone function
VGYLLDIVLALGVLALSEAGIALDLRAPWAVIALCAVPHALGWLAHKSLERGRFRSGQALVRVHGVCAPLLLLAALVAFGWKESIERWTGTEISFVAWPQFSFLAVLAPLVVYEALAIDSRSRLVAATGAARRAWRAFQMRMFLSAAIPITVYIAIAALIGESEYVRVHIEEVQLYNVLFASALLVLLALFLPTLLRNTWETEPIAGGAQRELLHAVAARAGFRSRALLVWKTGNQMANAAIVGLSARSRVVLFSDSLLAELDMPELAAVFAHEIGHAFRHHVPIFIVWVAAFFFGADLLASWLFPHSAWLSAGLVLAIMTVWYFAFGFMSRRFELDADLYSLELLGNPDALIGALERVGGRLRDVASWRHFSTSERVRFLSRAWLDPKVARALRSNLRAWTIAGALLFLLTAGLQVLALVKEYPREIVAADLRLGNYASAVRHAAGRELETDAAALVARAGEIGRDGVDGDAIERKARSALHARDGDAALAWLELGAMRGRRDLAEVRDALKSKRQGDVASVRDALSEDLWQRWRDDLEPNPPVQ